MTENTQSILNPISKLIKYLAVIIILSVNFSQIIELFYKYSVLQFI
jgi:hypothetical protein